jgi:hypothetical protein
MMLRAINRDFEPRRIEQPGLEAVSNAIQELDGRKRTLITLEIGDEHHMGVGGGAGTYIVYMTTDNLRFKNLVMSDTTGPKVLVTCGGQQGDFAAKQCVDWQTARKAAEAFAMTGQPDPELSWEDG